MTSAEPTLLFITQLAFYFGPLFSIYPACVRSVWRPTARVDINIIPPLTKVIFFSQRVASQVLGQASKQALDWSFLNLLITWG